MRLDVRSPLSLCWKYCRSVQLQVVLSDIVLHGLGRHWLSHFIGHLHSSATDSAMDFACGRHIHWSLHNSVRRHVHLSHATNARQSHDQRTSERHALQVPV